MKLFRSLLFLAGAMLAHPAGAAYPADKPITIVIGFAPGGGSDVLLRTITPGISAALGGQSVIVENKPGAGGNIAMSYVARAAPDGYTLLFCSPGLAINPTLYGNLTFDPLRDFAPIGLVGSVDNVLVVNPSLPVKTLGELIDYARKNPGKLNYASSGVGSSLHLAAELFMKSTDTQMQHVPFKSGSEALTAVISGQVDVYFDVIPDALPQIRQGKVRALAVTGLHRFESLPDVPTMQEAGVPGYTASTWNGILAPTGTPQDVIQKVNAAIIASLKSPDVLKRFKAMGQEARPGTTQAFNTMIHSETEKWRDIIQSRNIKIPE